ncbi:MAG: glycosyltransferase [Planctomycetales bacterium]|nr:glycosyltransferase [Planctomycetales bacterium]
MPTAGETGAGLSLVIPAFNEAEVIEQAVTEATCALAGLVPQYEILVVDDGSTDATSALVEKICQRDSRVKLIRHVENQGYGAALRTGFAAATGDLVAFTDADCQFDLSELDRFLLLARSYDAVCGYRIDRKDGWLRCLYSVVYNLIVRLLLGIRVRDVDCALKVFRRECLLKTTIGTEGFLVNSDLLTQIRRAGGSIVEVGVSHRPRAAGRSTVSVRHVPVVLTSLTRYWWNQLQFPASGQAATAPSSDGEHRRLGQLQWALLAIACFFVLVNLGYPLIDRDETRYAEIPREMLATGDWVLPTLNFKTYYDKPPMLYWLVAASYSVFGVNETAARLVPALAALGTLLLVMWFGNRHFGRRVGLASGVVLMLTVGFAFCSRYLLIDGVLTFFVTAALMSAYEAVCGERFRWRWWLAASVCCGLGFLTKGPLAIVLLLPIVVAHAWLTQGAAKVRWFHVAGLFAMVGVMAMPWMVAVTLRDDTFLREFFVNHNIRRFAGQYHARPVWYFLPVLLVGGFPWSFLAVPLTRHLASRSHASSRPPVIGFLCLWAAWMLAFFSASRCKLPTYLLPTVPAFALLLGSYVSRLIRLAPCLDRWEPAACVRSARGVSLTICFVSLAAIGYASWSGKAEGVAVGAGLVWGAALLCGICLVAASRRLGRLAWVTTPALAMVVLALILHQVVPSYSQSQTILASPNPVTAGVDWSDAVPIATVAHEFSEVPFYLRRDDIKNIGQRDDATLGDFVRSHPSALLVVDRHVAIEELRSHLPTGASLTLLGARGPAQLIRAENAGANVARHSSGGEWKR